MQFFNQGFIRNAEGFQCAEVGGYDPHETHVKLAGHVHPTWIQNVRHPFLEKKRIIQNRSELHQVEEKIQLKTGSFLGFQSKAQNSKCFYHFFWLFSTRIPMVHCDSHQHIG